MNADETKNRRRKIPLNPDMQGTVLVRSVLHWCFYVSAILLVVVIWTAIRDPSQSALKLVFESFVYFSPAIVASIILLPVFVYDALKATPSAAGPMFRLQCEMAKLTEGKQVDPLKFRDGDNWDELAENFNGLANRVMREP